MKSEANVFEQQAKFMVILILFKDRSESVFRTIYAIYSLIDM